MTFMARHLSRPVYEGLPWLYAAGGIVALVASYLLTAFHLLSWGLGVSGLLGLLGGFVVLLRRRDYREMRSQYANPDLLAGQDED